jgi:hypothetical protein
MTPHSRAGRKSGHVGKSTKAHPVHQRDHSPKPSENSNRPDFDERDRLLSPNRKAAGPQKKRRRSPPTSSTPPSTPDVASDDDLHGKNS